MCRSKAHVTICTVLVLVSALRESHGGSSAPDVNDVSLLQQSVEVQEKANVGAPQLTWLSKNNSSGSADAELQSAPLGGLALVSSSSRAPAAAQEVQSAALLATAALPRSNLSTHMIMLAQVREKTRQVRDATQSYALVLPLFSLFLGVFALVLVLTCEKKADEKLSLADRGNVMHAGALGGWRGQSATTTAASSCTRIVGIVGGTGVLRPSRVPSFATPLPSNVASATSLPEQRPITFTPRQSSRASVSECSRVLASVSAVSSRGQSCVPSTAPTPRHSVEGPQSREAMMSAVGRPGFVTAHSHMPAVALGARGETTEQGQPFQTPRSAWLMQRYPGIPDTVIGRRPDTVVEDPRGEVTEEDAYGPESPRWGPEVATFASESVFSPERERHSAVFAPFVSSANPGVEGFQPREALMPTMPEQSQQVQAPRTSWTQTLRTPGVARRPDMVMENPRASDVHSPEVAPPSPEKLHAMEQKIHDQQRQLFLDGTRTASDAGLKGVKGRAEWFSLSTPRV